MQYNSLFQEPSMKQLKLLGLYLLILLIMGCTLTYAQEENEHSHSQGGSMEELDAHLERIRQADNTANRKQILRHHIQMMQEQLQSMQAMGHGGMMGGGGMMGRGGMGGGMSQGQDDTNGALGERPHEDRGDCNMCHSTDNGSMNQGNGEGGMARGGMMGGMNQGDGEGGMARGDMMGGMSHGGGEGGMGGMMQHHTNMVKMMEHMLATQEMLLELIDE
jgi:hypothetical protein